jgi:hypothetical protein
VLLLFQSDDLATDQLHLQNYKENGSDIFLCIVNKFSDKVGPCHHGMALPQDADGGTASNLEGSGEYIE